MKSVNTPPTNHIKVLDGGQGWIGLLNHMGDESTITNSARVSFCKMKEVFDEKDEALLKYLIQNKHLTPLEHVKFQFSVHCPLFVRSQWMRHRAGSSFNEISRRYTEVDMEFYIPEVFRKQSKDNKQASIDEVVDNNKELIGEYNKLVKQIHSFYDELISKGVCKEQARGILPQTMFTTFWWTIDLRNLIHFLELRDDEHAQKEIREYAIAIKKLIEPYVPHVMQYIK